MTSLKCATCLSTDRDLTSVKNIFFYTNIWQDIRIKMKDFICWECKAIFIKIWKFKQNVLLAQKVLSSKGPQHSQLPVDGLSNLGSINTTNHNVIEMTEERRFKTEYCNGPFPYGHAQDALKYGNMADLIKFEHVQDLDVDVIYDHPTDNETVEYNEDYAEESSNGLRVESDVKSTFPRESRMYAVIKMTQQEMLHAREVERSNYSYKSRYYKCEKCVLGYFSENQYLKHVSDKHSKTIGEYVCRICDCHFPSERSLHSHELRHYVYYRCRRCSHQEKRRANILVHYNKRHKKSKMKVIVKKENFGLDAEGTAQEERPMCHICGQKFIKQGSLKKHILKHNDSTEYICAHCDKKFTYKRPLIRHMIVHTTGNPNETAYCVECNMQFKSNINYRNHLKHNVRHRPEEILKFECSECKKKFYCKTSLTRHLNKHFKIREHACNLCPKSFIRRDQLYKHTIYVHQGMPRPKNKMCSVCGRGFTRQSTLQNHMRTHTGEKPFQCDMCPASFAQKTSLTSHTKSVHLKLPKKLKLSNTLISK